MRGLWQGFFFTVARNPILLETIHLVVQRLQSHYYGCSPLDVTGPLVMGTALKRFYHTSDPSDWINNDYNHTDYVMSFRGIKTIITCCHPAYGRIVGSKEGLKPDPPVHKIVHDFRTMWCNLTLYHSHGEASTHRVKESRGMYCGDLVGICHVIWW